MLSFKLRFYIGKIHAFWARRASGEVTSLAFKHSHGFLNVAYVASQPRLAGILLDVIVGDYRDSRQDANDYYNY